jgi:hypothetical protein
MMCDNYFGEGVEFFIFITQSVCIAINFQSSTHSTRF